MNDPLTEQMAGRLHSAAIKLLRFVRKADDGGILSAPRLSALSVIIFAGPMSLAELAAAEQVRASTMSRMVDALVREELVTRETLAADRRSIRIAATEKGVEILEAARKQRVRALTARLGTLAESEKRALFRAIELLEKIARP